jgi:hypothetical protein
MGILSTRKPKRALVVLAALAAPVALLAASATPASADYCVSVSPSYVRCYQGSKPQGALMDAAATRDQDI